MGGKKAPFDSERISGHPNSEGARSIGGDCQEKTALFIDLGLTGKVDAQEATWNGKDPFHMGFGIGCPGTDDGAREKSFAGNSF